MVEIEGVQRATGRGREEWFALLDEWGASGREYKQVAEWLTGEHELSKWWAQKLIVEYQQARGLRAPGVRPDGTFEVTASKTIAVPVGRLFDAFVKDSQRSKWLETRMSLRTAQDERSARFDWEDGSTRVNVDFVAKGSSKSGVAIAHGRLADAKVAAATKEEWKDRLGDLKAYLETSS